MPEPGPDHFVAADDLEFEIDPSALQPDVAFPVVHVTSAEASSPVARFEATWRSLLVSSLVSALAALGAGLGTAFVLGLALASGSTSHDVTRTLLHAEAGLPITLVAVALIVVAVAASCLYSLVWALERYARIRTEAGELRGTVGGSVAGAAILLAACVAAGLSGLVATLIGLVALTGAQTLQLRRRA